MKLRKVGLLPAVVPPELDEEPVEPLESEEVVLEEDVLVDDVELDDVELEPDVLLVPDVVPEVFELPVEDDPVFVVVVLALEVVVVVEVLALVELPEAVEPALWPAVPAALPLAPP